LGKPDLAEALLAADLSTLVSDADLDHFPVQIDSDEVRSVHEVTPWGVVEQPRWLRSKELTSLYLPRTVVLGPAEAQAGSGLRRPLRGRAVTNALGRDT
jgi:hypothetical protein